MSATAGAFSDTFANINNPAIIKKSLIHHVKNCFDLIFKNKSNDNDVYLYYFISGGLYNIYLHWLENNCAETPKELSRLFTDFFTSPVR
ncbi:MAG: TetR family transcriptional regulator C-terminal domain-containing protein [Lachnospira sp.]|nr:TetR family transcriptional regulator C-terminal domain-containing protein [Lachnospira sp.]